jgi:hypothetical protein
MNMVRIGRKVNPLGEIAALPEMLLRYCIMYRKAPRNLDFRDSGIVRIKSTLSGKFFYRTIFLRTVILLRRVYEFGIVPRYAEKGAPCSQLDPRLMILD